VSWNRRPYIQRETISLHYARQCQHAYKIMTEYAAFAASIGCEVEGDTIRVFNEFQSRDLHRKWEELNP